MHAFVLYQGRAVEFQDPEINSLYQKPTAILPWTHNILSYVVGSNNSLCTLTYKRRGYETYMRKLER